MIPDWTAWTKSGRMYTSADGCIRTEGEHFHNAELRSFPPEAIADLSRTDGRIDWEALNELPRLERPVIGEHMYIRNFGDGWGWRISTPITQIV